MVTLSNHGGSCCGARHIYGFGTGDAPQNITQMHNKVAETPDRLTEIILNSNQCQSSPNLLAAMAERGFVLTTGFKNGNHDSSVFVFHRSDRRLRLDNTERDFGFVWPGQLAEPTLHGNLIPLTVLQDGGETGIPERYTRTGSAIYRQYLNRYPRDMVLTYRGPSANLQGAIFENLDQNTGWNWHHARVEFSDKMRVRNRGTGRIHSLALSSLRIHQYTQAPQQPAPAAPALGNQQYETAVVEQDVVFVQQPFEETVVYTTFHNVYRDGRIGAGYPTSQEARNASPRALNRLTRNIYNTGRVVDVQNEEG
jgi:hypothetical protein